MQQKVYVSLMKFARGEEIPSPEARAVMTNNAWKFD